jgi:mannose-6-phosphate isomerase
MSLPHPLPYPLKCRPIFKEKPWGGRRMEELFAKPLPSGQSVGESWEVADLKEGASLIANGALKDRTLTEAVHIWAGDLIGTAWNRTDRFPLLVKILDAHDDLSVQVHPDHTSCRKYFPAHSGKDETWVILESDADGAILWGFQKGTTLEEFLCRLEGGSALSILRRIPVKRGDCVRIAPGTVHALLKGVMLLEIQEPSDSTFRIYDYGRLVNGGRRSLHIEEARRVMNFVWMENPYLIPEVMEMLWGKREFIVECPAYRIERWEFSGMLQLQGLKETARVVFCKNGRVDVEDSENSFTLMPGETGIIPAGAQSVRLVSPDGARLVVSGAGGVNLLP